jgi:hypothetical protein
MPGSAGSPHVMQRAVESAEEDDSKETNIAVAHQTTEATERLGNLVWK